VIAIALDLADPGFLPRGPLRRPAIVAPRPREVSYGRIAGTVSAGTAFLLVKVDGVVRAQGSPTRRRRFRFDVPLPGRDVRVRVVALDALGNRRARSVGPVFGLPGSARPVGTRPTTEDATLARRVRRLARNYVGTAAVYVEDLRSRRGAAWNARARFPAASTVKVAIAVEVLRVLRRRPAAGSNLSRLLRRMLVYSDNAAANSLLTWIGGSTSGGAARVNTMLRELGIDDTYLYGGYILGTAAARPIPVRVDEQPAIGLGKYTTAHDLARLHRFVYLASGGRGPALRLPGTFTSRDARFLMWVLAHVDDPGKLDRYLAASIPVLHKAGWISSARHDAGIVFWRGGAFAAAVMTWNTAGVGTSSDVFAGRVAATSLDRYRQLRRDESATTADSSSPTA